MRKIKMFMYTVVLLGLVGCGNEEVDEHAFDDLLEDQTEVADAYYPVTITSYNYQKEPIEVTLIGISIQSINTVEKMSHLCSCRTF